MTYCGKCGKNNPDDSTFCWNCGEKLVPSSWSESVDESPACHSASSTGMDAGCSQDSRGARTRSEKIGAWERMCCVPEEKVKLESLGNYRIIAWILIIVAYCIGAYMLFGCKIDYSSGDQVMHLSLLDAVTGGYGVGNGSIVEILFCFSIIGFALTFTGYGGLIGWICSRLLFGSVFCLEVGRSVFEAQPSVVHWILGFAYCVVLGGALYCMSYAAIKYDPGRGCYKYGGVLDFLRGRSD